MLYAVVARPAVYGGRVKIVRRHRSDQSARRVAGGRDRGELPAAIQCRSAASPSSRENTWAAMQGRKALKIVWDDGPNARLRLGRLPEGRSRRRPASPARWCATTATSRPPWRRRRKTRRGRVLHPASRARDDGAAGRDGADREREVRGLGLLPVAAGRPRPGRETRRHPGQGCDRARHAAWRRLRPEVEARLRRRGGGALQGDGREAGQGHAHRPPLEASAEAHLALYNELIG